MKKGIKLELCSENTIFAKKTKKSKEIETIRRTKNFKNPTVSEKNVSMGKRTSSWRQYGNEHFLRTLLDEHVRNEQFVTNIRDIIRRNGFIGVMIGDAFS